MRPVLQCASGRVELIGSFEQVHLDIASRAGDPPTPGAPPYTHSELDPTNMLSLLASPPVQVEVASVRRKHEGLSANNPYLQPTRMTYRYDVTPSDMADRVIRAARLIAKEWAEEFGHFFIPLGLRHEFVTAGIIQAALKIDPPEASVRYNG